MESQPYEEKKGKSNDIPDIFNQETKEDLFCFQCLQIPKYTITIKKKGIIELSHKCKEREIITEFPLTTGTDIYSNSKCVYCNNECSNICLDCKKFVCKKLC